MLKLARSELRPLLILAFFMAVFVTASNFLVQFPINFFGMQEVLTYGAISYPVTFLITDLSNRRFGKIVARKSSVRVSLELELELGGPARPRGCTLAAPCRPCTAQLALPRSSWASRTSGRPEAGAIRWRRWGCWPWCVAASALPRPPPLRLSPRRWS